MVRERTSPLVEARALLQRQITDLETQIADTQAALLRLQTEYSALQAELRGLNRGAGLRRKQKAAE